MNAVAERISGNGNGMLFPAAETALQQAIKEVELQERLFELAQRKAKVYSESSLVPKDFQKNIGNVLIAENLARRLNSDQLMVMQNLFVVHGRPVWSSQFLIGTFNTCGRFEAIRYKMDGIPGQSGSSCVAYTKELSSGEVITGTKITWEIAKAEGWVDKTGSKWKTMPEQMMRYRAASWLIRTTAPEVGLGLHTKEEAEDFGPQTHISTHALDRLEDVTAQLERSQAADTDADPQSAIDPKSLAMAKYKSDLAATRTPPGCKTIYDAAFGPSQPIEWTADEQRESFEMAEQRQEQLKKQSAS